MGLSSIGFDTDANDKAADDKDGYIKDDDDNKYDVTLPHSYVVFVCGICVCGMCVVCV